MGTILPIEQKNDFETTPSGSHIAICYRVLDLGTQAYTFSGETNHKPTIMLSFELSEEKMKDGRPFSAHKRFKLSSFAKAPIRQFLESWRGQAFTDADFGTFDIKVLLGKPCMLGIVHEEKNGNTYSNITSVMKIPKGLNIPQSQNELVHFDLDNFNQEVYDGLSQSLRETIAKAPEYQKLKNPATQQQFTPTEPTALPDEESPFDF